MTSTLGYRWSDYKRGSLSKRSIDTTGAMNVDLSGYQPAGNYLTSVPIGGMAIGGVKNGGNVTINADGTMDAEGSGGVALEGDLAIAVLSQSYQSIRNTDDYWVRLKNLSNSAFTGDVRYYTGKTTVKSNEFTLQPNASTTVYITTQNYPDTKGPVYITTGNGTNPFKLISYLEVTRDTS